MQTILNFILEISGTTSIEKHFGYYGINHIILGALRS